MQRVGRELLRLAEPGPSGAFSISPLPTQSNLASQTGTTRETVARTLGQFAQDGLIERQGRRLRIPDRARLEALLAGLPARAAGRRLGLLRRDRRQMRERALELGLVVALVGQLAGEVVGVGLHVEMAVAAEVEQDHLALAGPSCT